MCEASQMTTWLRVQDLLGPIRFWALPLVYLLRQDKRAVPRTSSPSHSAAAVCPTVARKE